MDIGFIGAGKIGFSMGRYLSEHGVKLAGYYSRTLKSSVEAAQFNNTKYYTNIRFLVEDSDVIFLAVPDDSIKSIWEQLKMFSIQNKIIGHFSGALSSTVFSDIERFGAYGYSIHPLCAVNDKYNSHKELSKVFFTIEGHQKYLDWFLRMFETFGNPVQVIKTGDKVRYHAAAVMVSNLYAGLTYISEEILRSCGFSALNAHNALSPLISCNADNIVNSGTVRALTGPIERNDVDTVRRHINCMTAEELSVYRALSLQTLKIAKIKHPETVYDKMEEVLEI